MELKVDYEKIGTIGVNIYKDVENLKKKREELLKIIDDFNICWEGDDYEEFKENAGIYIRNLNLKIEELERISEFMQHASKKYSNNDDKWVSKLREMRKDTIWDQQWVK